MTRALLVLVGGACGALAIVLAAACSSYGSSDDHVSSDGAVDEASTSDVRNDDAGSSLDASDPDATCLEPFVLEETFPDLQSLSAWLVENTNGGATVTGALPNGVAPTSAPAALFVTGTVPDGGGDGIRASVSRSFTFRSVRGRFAFAVYVPQSTNYSEVGCVLRFSAPANPDDVTIQIYANTISLVCRHAGKNDGPAFDLGPTPSTAFTTVETFFDADSDAGVAHATVRRLAPGGTVLSTAEIGEIPLPAGANTMKLVCGVGYADVGTNPANRSLQVAVDDVAFSYCNR